MASTIPTSSGTVSPFMRRATMKAAICAGLAAPSRISAMLAWADVTIEVPPSMQGAEHDGPAAVRGNRSPPPASSGSARRRWRRMRRRSFSVAPPHTPSFSRPWSANSRQVSCTEHSPHTALAASASSSVAG